MVLKEVLGVLHRAEIYELSFRTLNGELLKTKNRVVYGTEWLSVPEWDFDMRPLYGGDVC